jgi:sugar diacid utilization regulator
VERLDKGRAGVDLDADGQGGRWARFGTTFPERQVAAIAEIGRTIVSSVGYAQVLAEVIAKVGKILDAESGGFMLYEEAAGELVLQKPAFGFDSDDLIDAYRVPLSGGGNAVTVFVSGEPYMTNDAPNDPRVLQHFVELYSARRILTVPLQVEGRPIGVFHALNKRSGDFTAQDLQLALLLAPQLAVIIQSARIMRELRRHEEQLERMIEIHNALVSMVLGGGDVAALGSRLSELIGLPVVVMDASGRTLRGREKGRDRVPPEVRQEMASLLAGSGASVDLDPIRSRAGGLDLMLIPIVVGSDLLGGVGTCGPAGQLEDLARRTLQQAALVFALEMVKEAEVYEVERRLHADVIQRFLVTDSEIEAANLLRRLDVDPQETLRGGRLRIVYSEVDAALPERRQAGVARLHRTLQLLLGRAWPGAVAVAEDRDLLLILPGAEDAESSALKLEGILRDLLASSPPPNGAHLFLGIGGVAQRPLELRRSLDEAATVVAARRLVHPGRRVVVLEQLGLLGLLARPAGPQDVDRYVERRLGPLLAYDAEHSSDWTTFASVLVECNFSVKAAARRLNLHFNTGRYRASRIEELLGIDLSSSAHRLDLQLALRLRELREALKPL